MEQYLDNNLHACYPKGMTAPCLRHGRKCPVFEHVCTHDDDATDGALTMFGSGPMCTPWCPSGKQMGYADPAADIYHIHVCGQQVYQPDCSFTENSFLFPPQAFIARMSPTHDVIQLTFGCDQIGWASNRRRWMAWSVKRETLVWTGPTGVTLKEN